MQPLISVVVPIYNVESYLQESINSIIWQTYTNLEIILVDDGSTDKCPQICDEFAKVDSRIKVIHKDNGGLSDARNAGLAVANGELIGFVDSDDYIHVDMFRLLYENMIENNSDISVCGVEKFWDNTSRREMLTTDYSGVLSNEQAMSSIINEDNLKQPVWHKLYKAVLIKDIPFPVGKQHEDVFWSYRAIGRTKKVSVFSTPLYFYRQRENSIMGNSFSLKHLDSLEAKIQRNEYVDKHFPDLSQQSCINLWFSCIYLMQMSLKYLSLEKLTQAKQIILDSSKTCKPINVKHINGFKTQIWWILSKLSFMGTCKLRNLLRIGL